MQTARSQPHSPPPSYCSGDTREVATTSRSSQVPVSESNSQPSTSRVTTVPATASPQPPTAAAAEATTTSGPRTPQFPESFQSLDNIDLTIFGSVDCLADGSTAANNARSAGPGNVQSRGRDSSSGGGVVLDVSAVFTGSRPPTRLMTPRFRPRPSNRGHVFEPTALYPVEESSVNTWERGRTGVSTRL